MPERQLFISHKMPTDTKLATRIGGKIGLYTSNSLRVVHAGLFRTGEDFLARVRKEIERTDIFLWLYTGQDEDWSNCMFECGYFDSLCSGNPDKLLVVLRREASAQVPVLIQQYNNVVVTADSMFDFLKQLYHGNPWSFAPNAELDDVRKNAQEIASIFNNGIPKSTSFELVPSFRLEFAMDDAGLKSIRAGRIPDDCSVAGREGWQELFGKQRDTGDWKWADLTAQWPLRPLYEYEFAKMMERAWQREAPQGCFLRSEQRSGMYRVSLQRFSFVSDTKTSTFHFSAAPIDIPFYLGSGDGDRTEALLYHLLNMSWYIRRRLVDKNYVALIREASNPTPNPVNLQIIVDGILDELNNIDIQAIVRGIDSKFEVDQVLPTLRQTNSADYAKRWLDCRKQLAELAATEDRPVRKIVSALHEMAILNYTFCQHSARAFAKNAEDLALPIDPASVF